MSEHDGKVEKSEAEWRKELTPMQYAVLREKATERPFSGEYEHEHRQGTYTCAGCGQTLFESDAKFDSGCGWPSFTAARAGEPCRRGPRRQPRHGPHRGAVLEVQRPSRPRVRGRPRPDRTALLHQFGGAEAAAEVDARHAGLDRHPLSVAGMERASPHDHIELFRPVRPRAGRAGFFSSSHLPARNPGNFNAPSSRRCRNWPRRPHGVHVIQPALPPTGFAVQGHHREG